MTAMRRMVRAGSEQMIGALVPDALRRPEPVAAPLPVLPMRRLPTDPQVLPVLDLACLDRSGRLSVRAILCRLGWGPGHRLVVEAVRGVLLVAPAVDGRYVVGSRGDLALPATGRALCHLATGQTVVVAAYPAHELLLVHPVDAVAGLVQELHVRLAAADGG